jgi:hypothetical protein
MLHTSSPGSGIRAVDSPLDRPRGGDLKSPPAAAGTGDGRHDFDFLHGRWWVRNERLRERLAGCQDWEVFDGVQECRPVLEGVGNVDELRTAWGGGFAGLSLRLFDLASGQWRIWWASSRDGLLDPPVVGGFEDGRGCFTGRGEHAGRPVLMRFTWDRIGRTAAHWQQEFSPDDGASWETNWHMWLRRLDPADRLVHEDAVVELRQYTLHPDARDTLVDLFEREFIEPQEAVGMHVIGQFQDLDDPARFVWLRGFASMPARRDALQAFYGGPVWQRHREAANATMLDSDDVLLLKPAGDGRGLPPAARARPGAGEAGTGDDSPAAAAGAFGLGLCTLAAGTEAAFADRFEREWAPLLRQAGADLRGRWLTEASANTFPRLPVREGEHVFAWLVRVDSVPALDAGLARLRESPAWREAIAAGLLDGLERAPQWLRLAPTPRSELR